MSAVATYSLRDAVRLPGLVSLTRLPLALAFPWSLRSPVLALGLLVTAAISDVLDGRLARRLHQQTATGAALDALMDKVFVVVVVFTLVYSGSLSILEAVLLGTRDLAELPLVAILAATRTTDRRPPPMSNPFGKLATVLQFLTIAAILMGTSHREVWILATSVSGALAGVSYWLREHPFRPWSAD